MVSDVPSISRAWTRTEGCCCSTVFGKESRRPDILLGEGVLDTSEERAGGPSDQRSTKRLAESIFGVVGMALFGGCHCEEATSGRGKDVGEIDNVLELKLSNPELN
jgi:hypothetical protein